MSSVNDAYSVSLSPSSCVINADYNGKNPKLTYAYSDIRVIRGETAVPFDKPKFLSATNNSGGDIIQIDETTWRVQFTSIPETDLSGSVQFEIKVGTDFQTVVTFAYTVVRETSMLDWILDWNGTYTEISGKWIITPKIFAGTKDVDNKITGVYLGPAFDNDGSTGLYGYKDDEIIFRLTETGGYIGGWSIENGGIQTSDGFLKILAEGSIISAPFGVTAWELNKNGSATFAKGNVKFNVDGSAEFAGRITSSSGLIGGWGVSLNQIRSNHIILDSDKHLIGINADIFQRIDPTTGDVSFPDSPKQAIKFWYNTENDWGLAGWDASNKVFQLGSSNFIAGWNFDNVALWTGVKNNTARQNTASEGDITIGSAGLRGMNWYIDHDGEISFVNGLIHFDKNGGTISGWTLNPKRLNTKHAALISNESFCGLYLTLGDLSESADGSISQVVHSKGGIEIVATQYNAYIWAHESDGTPSFYISASPEDVNWIGGWCFDGDAIFRGTKVLTKGQYTPLDCITLGVLGLRGPAWRFEADGSGAVAKGNITWDENGNVIFANSVKLAWSQITGTDDVMTTATYIDANGIFTGKINANNIITGTLSSERINADELLSNGEKWALLKNGSGYLASKNLTWDENGNLSVTGKIEATSGSIAGFAISNGRIGIDSNAKDDLSGSQDNWANLTITKDFFKVGGAKGYAMFGDDVLPGSLGGAFTAVGRIVNSAPNTLGQYGFDQANYGIFIDVTGGTKNYGISSNAALIAPAFISTKAQVLEFNSSGTYKVDVSQKNTILLYAPTTTNMTLPTEQSIAQQFGMSSLPDDFCAMITILLYNGSKTVILKNIYNGNGVQDYPISLESYVFHRETINMNPVKLYFDQIAPSSIMLLVTKIGGFRYQVVSYTTVNNIHF